MIWTWSVRSSNGNLDNCRHIYCEARFGGSRTRRHKKKCVANIGTALTCIASMQTRKLGGHDIIIWI